MGDRLEALVTAATKAASGMGEVAARKPDEAPLQSDARTFRGIAAMLQGLSAEANAREQTVVQLRRILQRIAMLELRGASEMVELGDWKGLVEEIQAMAQDVLGAREGAARRQRRTT